jgi:hypothetical protein
MHLLFCTIVLLLGFGGFRTFPGQAVAEVQKHRLLLRAGLNVLYIPFREVTPDTPRLTAVAPESLCCFGAALTAPAIPASESTLGSHLCVALSSDQMFSEWTTSTQPCNDFSLDGDYPLTCCLTPRVHSKLDALPLSPFLPLNREIRTQESRVPRVCILVSLVPGKTLQTNGLIRLWRIIGA